MHLPAASRRIFMLTVGAYLVFFLLDLYAPRPCREAVRWFGQTPQWSLGRFYVWQFVTYMFVHVDVMHILFNMLIFWFMAPPVEMRLGRRAMMQLYLVSGAGAGVLQAAISLLFGRHGADETTIIGASGAIMGLTLAFAAYFPNQVVLIWGVVPMKVKRFVVLLIALEIIFGMSGSMGLIHDNISHVTHVTGIVSAYGWLAWRHRTWDMRRWAWMH